MTWIIWSQVSKDLNKGTSVYIGLLWGQISWGDFVAFLKKSWLVLSLMSDSLSKYIHKNRNNTAVFIFDKRENNKSRSVLISVVWSWQCPAGLALQKRQERKAHALFCPLLQPFQDSSSTSPKTFPFQGHCSHSAKILMLVSRGLDLCDITWFSLREGFPNLNEHMKQSRALAEP